MLKTFRPDDESLAAIAVGNRKADLAHDAAYAHALVLAIHGAEENVPQWSDCDEYIREHAKGIMDQWGYIE